MNVVKEERQIEVGAAGRRYNEIRNNVSSHVVVVHDYQEFTGFSILVLFNVICYVLYVF